jgi:glycosyltransferase involved in cell wall biosynthesis
MIDRVHLTVVVSTFNRAALLSGCLDSLAAQTIDKSMFDIIVVDNNSKDNTKEVVLKYMEKLPNLRYVFEADQGLSHARNRGWKEATGEYVSFIDDDAKASPDWIEKIISAFETVKPDPVAVGGRISPWYEKNPPGWFDDNFEIRSWGNTKGFLQPPQANYGFSGSNMAFPKNILVQYGGFHTDLGMKGNKLSLGEETAFFYKIYPHHPLFWYDPDISVKHWTSARNMTLSYRLKRAYMGGFSIVRIHGEYSTSFIIKKTMSVLLRSCILPFRIPWWQDRWQKYFLKHAEPVMNSAGALKGMLSLLLNREKRI